MAVKGIERLKGVTGAVTRRGEARRTAKRLERCEGELSRALEGYGEACFARTGGEEKLREEVAALREEKTALEKRLDELRGIRRCAECGAALEAGDAFCRKCGCAAKPPAAPAVRILWPREQPGEGP